MRKHLIFAVCYLAGAWITWTQYGIFYYFLGKLTLHNSMMVYLVSVLASIIIDVVNDNTEQSRMKKMIRDQPVISGLFLGNGFNLPVCIFYQVVNHQFSWVECFGLAAFSGFLFFSVFQPLKDRFYWDPRL